MPTYDRTERAPVLPAVEPVTIRPGAVLLDWLTLNLRAPEPGSWGHPWGQERPVTWDDETDTASAYWRRYVVEPTDIRTSQFARVAYLTRGDGTKAATIWSQPHNGALSDPQWIQVQFANDALHTGEWVSLFRMFRAYGCELTGISRVDISADGIEGEGGEFPAVVQGAIDGRWRYYGHGSWRPELFRSKVTGFNFGTRGSNKYVRAYRKAREMKHKGVKPWIVDAWAKAWGFDVYAAGLEVNRMEVQTKAKELRRYFADCDSVSWVEGLNDERRRVDVFASMAPGLFDFRTHAARARDAVPVVRWDWSGVASDVKVATRAQRTHGFSDHTIKTNLRAMWTVGTGTSSPDTFRAAEAFARSCGPQWEQWYERKRLEWSREWIRYEKAREQCAHHFTPLEPHAARVLMRTAEIVDAMRNDRAEMERHARNLDTLRRIDARAANGAE